MDYIFNDVEWTTVVQSAIAGILLVAVFIWFLFRGGNGGKDGHGKTLTGGYRRTELLLCGPCGGGKTTIFSRLVDPSSQSSLKDTRTSMELNRATVKGTYKVFAKGPSVRTAGEPQPDVIGAGPEGAEISYNVPVVDFPGHPRLTADLLGRQLRTTKVVVLVIDSLNPNDTDVGVPAVATLFAKIAEHSDGGSALNAVVFACNKRDDIASWSSKAVRRMLEKELTRYYIAKGAAIGSVAKAQEQKKQSETGLVLEEGKKFSFSESMTPMPCFFCDVSTATEEQQKSSESIFDLSPLVVAATTKM